MAPRVLRAKAERSARQLAIVLDAASCVYLAGTGYALVTDSVGLAPVRAAGFGWLITLLAVVLGVMVSVLVLVVLAVRVPIRTLRVAIVLALGGAVPVGALIGVLAAAGRSATYLLFSCWSFVALLHSASYLRRVRARVLLGSENVPRQP